MQEIESADEAQPKSFLKAKWFPVAASSLALVIAIGGHAFTALNSVQVANHGNRIDGLEAFKQTTETASGGRDREFQTLQAEVGRLQRQSDEQRAEIAQLKTTKPQTVDKSELPAGFAPVNEQAQRQSELAKAETKPLPNGVSAKFDSVIRARMKPFWEQPRYVAVANTWTPRTSWFSSSRWNATDTFATWWLPTRVARSSLIMPL